VPSAEEAAERVRGSGGEVVAGPAEVTVGKIAVVRDPQGAMFALYEGEVDP
jgi:predicted enzyme related to lactoylglutathione lyase